MRAIAVYPGKPNSIHLADLPKPALEEIPNGRGVLVRLLRCGVDGTDKEINAAEYGQAPAVMVTGCAILLGGLLSRYAAINDRLRLLAHERLDLLRIANSDPEMSQTLLAERLGEIDGQVPDLSSRHKQERDAVLSAYCAAIAFIVTMFGIALAALVESDIVATVAFGLFLFGTAVLACGVILTTLEVRTSQRSVEFEVRRIIGLSVESKRSTQIESPASLYIAQSSSWVCRPLRPAHDGFWR